MNWKINLKLSQIFLLMDYRFRNYNHDQDFLKIRAFLVQSYSDLNEPINWTIERWNYAYYFIRDMFETSLEDWESRVGIWENKDKEVVAVVSTEGLNMGEAFFLYYPEILNENLLKEMFDFAEEKLMMEEEDKRVLKLRIRVGEELIERNAIERGYVKHEKATDGFARRP